MLVKWVLVPIALLALGYFLVGPRIGAGPTNPSARTPSETIADADQAEPEPKLRPEPSVEVSATPVNRRRARQRSSTRKPLEGASEAIPATENRASGS